MNRGTLACLLAAVLAGAGCTHRPAPAVEPPRPSGTALEHRQQEFFAAMGDRDLDRTAALFAEDAVAHVAGMPPVRGHEAIRQLFGNVFRFLEATDTALERLHVAGSGDLAYGHGRVTNTFRGDPRPVEYVGKFLLVWERRQGQWQVVAYSISNDSATAGR
jgi:ketosteroid isomerase-like protein